MESSVRVIIDKAFFHFQSDRKWGSEGNKSGAEYLEGGIGVILYAEYVIHIMFPEQDVTIWIMCA